MLSQNLNNGKNHECVTTIFSWALIWATFESSWALFCSVILVTLSNAAAAEAAKIDKIEKKVVKVFFELKKKRRLPFPDSDSEALVRIPPGS